MAGLAGFYNPFGDPSPDFRGPAYGWDVPGVDPTQTGSISGPLAGSQAAAGGPLSGTGTAGWQQRAMQFLDPQVALPMAAQLMAGGNLQESLAGAFGAAGQAIPDMRKRQAVNAWLKARSTGEPLSPEMQQVIQSDPVLAQKLMEKDLGLGAGGIDTGLTPQWSQDADGNWHQFLPSRTGVAKELVYPPGYHPAPPVVTVDTGTGTQTITRPGGAPAGPVIPKDVAGAASQGAQGAAQGAAVADLPRAVHAADTMIETIDQALADPEAISAVTGPIQSHLPNVTALANRGQSYIDKIQGGTFLQAYAVLKGGGQITEIEGAKAEAALNRLRSTGMSDTDYVAALKEFRAEVLRLAEIAKQRAQGGGPASAAGGAVTDPGGAAADPWGLR